MAVNDFYIGKYEVTQWLWTLVMGKNPSYGWIGNNLPIAAVSWNDAQLFIKKLNEMTGKNYRLPTEAEWEYAARGGNKSKGYEYSGSDDFDEVADGLYGRADVGTKKANELGIHDMTGSVREWVNDWYSSDAKTDTVGSPMVRDWGWYGNCDFYPPNAMPYSIGFRLAHDP